MPAVLSQPVSYSKSVRSTWPRGPCVQVQIEGFKVIPIHIPFAFLTGSGDNSFNLVSRLIQYLVVEPGELLHAVSGEAVDLERELLPTLDGPLVLDFKPIDPAMGFTWATGPESSTRGKPKADDEDEERASLATPSTAQVTLKSEVLSRDGVCLVTGSHDIVALDCAHLCPKSRQDIYARVLGDDWDLTVHDVSMAVLLKTDFHRLYDGYRWSFYYHGADMYIHVFSMTPDLMPFHGKRIPKSFFSRWQDTPDALPDRRLCNWHYQQCAIMRLRRFSHGLSPADAFA